MKIIRNGIELDTVEKIIECPNYLGGFCCKTVLCK
ncbi:hypothetical protein JOC49_002185 [Fusibacter tunisiensis]|uniref:Uncharacterized protein n=1 Tax=Fusibacter tunisiensis TaxID=1008308 RepID=A0ABS2MT91_9FIRM|nr:hypothetical protein [Fusibacter tunisiensis]